MDLFIILLLLIGGLLLLVLELVAIPGTTIAGISGVGLLIYGIIRVYAEYGDTWGTISFVVSLVIGLSLLFYSLRAKTWRRFALNHTIEGKVNEIKEEDYKVGDKGISITRLASVGIAEFNGERIEVFSATSFVDPKTKIEIERIEGNKIYVRPIE